MRKTIIIFMILCCFTSCIGGPRFSTQPTRIDVTLDLEKAVAQTQMALSVAELQYMIWTLAVKAGQQIYDVKDETRMSMRILELRQTIKILADELAKRTNVNAKPS